MNLRRQCQQIYSLPPLSAWVPTRETTRITDGNTPAVGRATHAAAVRRRVAATGSVGAMPSFDVTSEIDYQEVRNAVDQASREVATRFDFKNTGASLELKGHEISLHAPTEDRLRALVQVL